MAERTGKKKKVSSKGNLKTIPSDILSNEITGTWILYQYNWDQIVALHLDFKQACTALWWLILFVAVQPNITRVNRSYYSDLNLVFHGEVGDGDQESSVLGTTVHNCLRCVTRSLNFLWSIKILITAKGRLILLAAHTVLQQEPQLFPGRAWPQSPLHCLASDWSLLVQAAFWWLLLEDGMGQPLPLQPGSPLPGIFMHIISCTCLNLWSSASFLFDGWVSDRMLKSQKVFVSALWLTVGF